MEVGLDYHLKCWCLGTPDRYPARMEGENEVAAVISDVVNQPVLVRMIKQWCG